MVHRVALFLVAAASLILVLWYSQHREPAVKVSGFIEADEIRVGSRIGGRVLSVFVEEGQRVVKDDLLVELEPFDLQERHAALTADLSQAQAELDRLQAGFRVEEIAQAASHVDQLAANLRKLEHGPRQQEIEAAQAQLQLAESERELALVQKQRSESLVAQRAVSREEFDSATTQLRVAQARVTVSQATLALLNEGTRQEDVDRARAQLEEAQAARDLKTHGFRAEEIAAAMAAVDAARADEQAMQRQLDELRVVAPLDGSVEAVELQPGDLVAANAAVISLIDLSHLWVRAYVPENQLGLQLNQIVPVTVDSYPGESFRGRITFISRQAEFTPGNVQTPEERSKQVFRIKVTLLDGLDRLRPGMSADVWLDEGPPP